jgi:hypothetical protein
MCLPFPLNQVFNAELTLVQWAQPFVIYMEVIEILLGVKMS